MPYDDDDFDYIETAVNLGVVNGEIIDDEDYFKPMDNVTRYQLCQSAFLIENIDYSNRVDIRDVDLYDNQGSKGNGELWDNGFD